MAFSADSSVVEKALAAQEGTLRGSASQRQPSPSSTFGSRSRQGVVLPQRANESVLFDGMNLAHAGSVEVVLLALDIPFGTDKGKEEGIASLSSTSTSTTKSKSSKRSLNSLTGKTSDRYGSLDAGLQLPAMPMRSDEEKYGCPALPSAASPLIKSKSSKLSGNLGKQVDGIPPLTSTCSPLIASKSSKSSSNQGSLPGLVVAPDGVTLVKDRRKCKPRGVLTVGRETSSFSSDGEVNLPVPSPSVATVEWVDEHWNDAFSPQQSHPDELNCSCSTVASSSLRSPRVALNFDLHQDCSKERARDVWSKVREVVNLGPEVVLSTQVSHDLQESVEGLPPRDLTFAGSDVDFRPAESTPERLTSGKDHSVPTVSSQQPQFITSTQEISSQNHTGFSDTDYHHYVDIRQSLQLELQDDVNGSSSVENSKRSCDYSLEVTPLKHSETRCLITENGEAHLGMSENRNSEVGSVCPLSVSPGLLGPLGNDDAGSADDPLGGMPDSGAQNSPIVTRKLGGGFEIRSSGFSKSPEELVAETLYELAAENLRKTRTAARTFDSPEEKKSRMETTSLLSIEQQPVPAADTSSCDERATRTDAVPYAVSSGISRQVSLRSEVTKLDFAQPLRTIILSGDSQFSDELATLKALIGNVRVGALDNQVLGLPRTIRREPEEAQGPAESISPFPKKPQRQRRRLSNGYYTNSRSPIRKVQQQQQRRLSLCGKLVGFGSILAATAAIVVVVVSLAMGSCQQCYKSNHHQYYIRPT